MNDSIAPLLDEIDAARDFRERFEARRRFPEVRDRARSFDPGTRRAIDARLDAITARFDAADASDVAEAVAASRRGDRVRFVATLAALTEHSPDPADESPHYGDEALDAFLERMLGTFGRYDGGPSPGEEMIHYDPSPASATLAIARRGWLAPESVFVDVGSGTGRVVILAAMLGRARCVGVEIDAPLVEVAAHAARSLGAEVEFRVGDARAVPLEDGTHFFFFAPFVGNVLDDVLERLRALASSREIHVGTWGPSTAAIARASWLVPDRSAPYGAFDLATFSAGPSTSRRSSSTSPTPTYP